MNCHDCETLLLRDPDHLGSTAERAALAAHVAECPVCRRLQTGLAGISDLIRHEAAAVSVPDATAEWHKLQSRLHPVSGANRRRRSAPLLWFGAPMAAAAALLLAFVLQRPTPQPTELVAVASTANASIASRAEYVQPGNANASTMVYVDKQSGWLVVWATDAAPAKG